MITVTYDYTGQNSYAGNLSRTFETEAEFHNWVRVDRPFIYHVQGYRGPTTTNKADTADTTNKG
jgi:hypothetical protein